MVHIFNSSKEAGASGESEFKTSLMYIWDNKTHIKKLSHLRGIQ